jgi:hypothetical protein
MKNIERRSNRLFPNKKPRNTIKKRTGMKRTPSQKKIKQFASSKGRTQSQIYTEGGAQKKTPPVL